MTKHILIADDEPAIVEQVGELLEANGYTYDAAGDLETTKAMLSEGTHAALILDMDMPLKPQGLHRHRNNGYNFLEKMRKEAATNKLPVLVYTGQDGGEAKFQCGLLRVGGIERTYVAQKNSDDPYEELTCALRWLDETINPPVQAVPEPASLPSFTDEPRRMVITEEAITLCDVEVWTDHAQDDMREVMVALAQRTANGRYRRVRGPKLNEMVDREPTNPISKPIQRFRDRCTELMASQCQLSCGKFDVIGETTGGGYHLHDCIEVIVEEGQESLLDDEVDEPTGRAAVKQWILDQLAEGAAIYPKDVVAAFSGRRNRSSTTRDLAALRDEGVIGKGRKALIIPGNE